MQRFSRDWLAEVAADVVRLFEKIEPEMNDYWKSRLRMSILRDPFEMPMSHLNETFRESCWRLARFVYGL